MNIERWERKAQQLARAWSRRFDETPTLHAVILALCVAQHETRCGDAWPGPDGVPETSDDENNWGATTFRSLNAAERAAVAAAGVRPTVGKGHKEAALQAMAALAAAGIPSASGTLGGITVPSSTIHCDSKTTSKGLEPYFVWFANFTTPEDGAEYFLHLLAGRNKRAKAVLDSPAGDERQLAAAMYAAGYFWGFKPHAVYTDKEGKTHDGNQENIDAYANALRRLRPGITAALAAGLGDWQLTDVRVAPDTHPHVDLTKPIGVQRALNLLGCGRPLLKLDGDFGTKSIAALGFYQGGTAGRDDVTPLDVTGKWDEPETREALRRDLEALGHQVST